MLVRRLRHLRKIKTPLYYTGAAITDLYSDVNLFSAPDGERL